MRDNQQHYHKSEQQWHDEKVLFTIRIDDHINIERKVETSWSKQKLEIIVVGILHTEIGFVLFTMIDTKNPVRKIFNEFFRMKNQTIKTNIPRNKKKIRFETNQNNNKNLTRDKVQN